ncbi:MAG: peptidylprolyl isomerase, partial [Alphaproteobacteria bacterium]
LGNDRCVLEREKVLDILVDEQIKGQAAVKQGFSVSEKDIKNAITRLEQQNNLPAGGMLKALRENHISENTLYTQIKADLLWLQVIGAHKASLTPVTEADIRAKQKELKQELADPSYLVAEIVVPTKTEADAVVAQLKSGRDFSEVAAQKSIAASKQTQGFVGWIKKEHYPDAVMAKIAALNPNEMSRPMKVKDGYLLVLLLDKREAAPDGNVTVWEIAQMATSRDKTVALLPTILAADTCDAFMEIAAKNAIKESVQRGQVNPNGLPVELKAILAEQKNAAPVGPVQTSAGDLFFMKCGQQTHSLLPSAEAIQSALEMKKMEELSDKLFRQVKRYAVIEYK